MPPVDPTAVMISLATAALRLAELDAAQNDQIIFRDEWKPTPRTRSSTIPPATQARRKPLSWLVPELRRIVSDLENQRSNPSPHTAPTTSASQPALASQPASQPVPSQPAHASQPASRPASAPASAPPLPPFVAARRAPLELPNLEEGAVGKLLRDNHVVFSNLIDHSFPQALGKGSASLDGFRYYMTQDKFYLESCARVKMVAVSQDPNFKAVENFSSRHKSSLEAIKEIKNILTSMLGVPENIIDATPRSKDVDASEKFYRDSILKENASFIYYVLLLPCVLSYWKVAERLMNDSSTLQNVVYYPAWIEPNYDPSSTNKYIKFINENIMVNGGVDRWNYVFKIACHLEADLFNTGLQAPTPYPIIPNGIYAIRGSGVLLFENIGGFPAVSSDRRKFQKWRITATTLGYTFQNIQTGHFIGIPADSGKTGSRLIRAIAEPSFWWINPVSNQPLSYQIFESGNLRYTWTFSFYHESSVIVTDNAKHPTQNWTFEPDVVNR